MDPDDESGGSGLGSWARFKRMLARQWLRTIEVRRSSISDSEAGESQALIELSAVGELVAMTTPTLVAEGAPAIQNVTRANMASLSPPLRPRSNSPQGSGSGRRPSSGRPASGMMVEERDIDSPEDLEQVDWTGVGRSVENVLGSSPRVSFV